jgi:hypothetical protein
MTGRGEGESYEALAEHRLGRSGMLVKLDKGFEAGVYCIYVEFEGLADRIGFAAARRQAMRYAARIKAQLARAAGYAVGETEDPSRTGGPGRKRDLETTFLSFTVTAADGRFHDAGLQEQFRLALLRADQKWDQLQARADEGRRDGRRERFRQQLGELLSGDAYQHLDRATKERLLAEVTDLAVPARGRER